MYFQLYRDSGRGYRTVKPGTQVKFEVLESKSGLTAHNIQQ
jgi:cold shock CspA family protein